MTYIQQLKAETEAYLARQAAEVELNRVAKTTAARERLQPIDERLRRLLIAVPTDVQREGLSLTTLAGMLRGRRGGGAQTGAVGAALRRLGWKRTRCWRGGADAGGFSALWHPPGTE